MKKVTSKDVIIDFIGLALVGVVAAVVLVLLVGFSSSAAENTYTCGYTYLQTPESGGQFYRSYDVKFSSQYPIFFINEKGSGFENYKVGTFDGKSAEIWSANTVNVQSYYMASYQSSNGNLYREETDWTGAVTGGIATISVNTAKGETFNANGYVFDSLDSATEYYLTGDASGLLQAPDGFIDYVPDIESARESGLAKLIDFKADSSFSCSWSGVEGATTIDEETLESVECSTNNAFVAFEFGIATTSAPGKIVNIVKYDKYVLTSQCSFSLDASEILTSSNAYILYVKATPYTYANDDPTTRLRRGYSSYAYFDVNGSVSWVDTVKEYVDETLNGRRDGTVRLTDFYLSNVELKEGLLGSKTITWSGTTKDSDLMLVSEEDALVIVTYIVTEADYSYTVKEYTTCKISDGKCSVNYIDLIEESEANSFAWDGDIWLTPVYVVNGLLYQGEPTIVDISNENISNVVTDIKGTIGDTVENISGAVSGSIDIDAENMETNILSYLANFFSLLGGLVKGMGSLPNMYRTVFAFMPSIYIEAIGTCLFILIILRVLGR